MMAASMKRVDFCKLCRKCHLCTRFRQISTQNQEKQKNWKAVIGLEIHAQIASNTKLFSRSGTAYGKPVNSQVSVFDAALPGTLPVINRQCVEAGVKTALALGCHINKVSRFDRKHYFYADLPQGYQITQYRQPLAVGGEVKYLVYKYGKHKQIKPILAKANLTQIQLEQDSGKSLHDEEEKQSLIDLNRAGIGLMEIVTEPEFNSGQEAAGFVKELKLILRKIGTCSGKMAEGAMRVDANISVHQPGEPLGVRTEVKNIGSIKHVAKAIDYEISRQISVLNSGGRIVNETRAIDVETGETVPMRDKEVQQDYRFMPEPNLPPLRLYDDYTLPSNMSRNQVINIDSLKRDLPPLPEEIRERIQTQYNLSVDNALIIVNEDGMLEYFEKLMENQERPVEKVTNFLVNCCLGQLRENGYDFQNGPLDVVAIAEIIDMMMKETLSLEFAQKVVEELMKEECTEGPRDIVQRNNWVQISDEEELTNICAEVIQENQDLVKKYKKGKKKILNAFIGKAMQKTDRRGHGEKISLIFKKLLTDEN